MTLTRLPLTAAEVRVYDRLIQGDSLVGTVRDVLADDNPRKVRLMVSRQGVPGKTPLVLRKHTPVTVDRAA